MGFAVAAVSVPLASANEQIAVVVRSSMVAGLLAIQIAVKVDAAGASGIVVVLESVICEYRMNPLVSGEDGIGIPVVAPVCLVQPAVVTQAVVDTLGLLPPEKPVSTQGGRSWLDPGGKGVAFQLILNSDGGLDDTPSRQLQASSRGGSAGCTRCSVGRYIDRSMKGQSLWVNTSVFNRGALKIQIKQRLRDVGTR